MVREVRFFERFVGLPAATEIAHAHLQQSLRPRPPASGESQRRRAVVPHMFAHSQSGDNTRIEDPTAKRSRSSFWPAWRMRIVDLQNNRNSGLIQNSRRRFRCVARLREKGPTVRSWWYNDRGTPYIGFSCISSLPISPAGCAPGLLKATRFSSPSRERLGVSAPHTRRTHFYERLGWPYGMPKVLLLTLQSPRQRGRLPCVYAIVLA